MVIQSFWLYFVRPGLVLLYLSNRAVGDLFVRFGGGCCLKSRPSVVCELANQRASMQVGTFDIETKDDCRT